MRMIKFSKLLDELLITPSTNQKVVLLTNYFKEVEQSDRGWALSILSGQVNRRGLTSNDLRGLIEEKVPKRLFEYSYDYVGDLAETISLLWPKNDPKKLVIKLTDLMKALVNKSKKKEELLSFLNNTLDRLTTTERFSILKILTGGMRVGVSNGLLKKSLSKIGCRNLDDIDENWYAFTPPYFDLFSWLNGGSLPTGIKKEELFHSFMLANNFNEKNFSELSENNYVAEYKWDGIRAQIIYSDKTKIYSRSGDDITESFPELGLKSKKTMILDGELIIKKNNKILSFNHLQKRIGRKVLTKKILQEYPIHLIAYDIIYHDGIDIRRFSFCRRREILEKTIRQIKSDNISISEIINFTNWGQLREIRNTQMNNHIEGVMIKNKNSLYLKGRSPKGWYKWKRNPYTSDFILIYAQRGHGKRSSFYSDFTFGCWLDINKSKLVPVGKAYSGFTNEELKKLDRWVRNNTIERFGPVRSLKPGLVVEIAFENINTSSRHKSGLALRFPRFSRIRWDKPIDEVCVLDEVKKLINQS